MTTETNKKGIVWIISQKLYVNYIKRTLDILLSLITLPFLFITIIVFSPLIYFSDKGRVFYNAERIGRNGKLFKMFKFRSMSMNAPDIRNEDGSTYNGANDPRVTRIGRFMRKNSIDELPQIFNILLGCMSFIGPRPDPPDDMLIYTDEQKQKLLVKPGITGYNQAYYRNSVLQNEKFEHDLYYTRNISFMLDVRIFFKTIGTVVYHSNVYNEASKPSQNKILNKQEQSVINNKQGASK